VPKPEPFRYVIEWLSAFELTELDEANAALLREQANQLRLQYMTKDEVRKMNELDPLPNGEGASLQIKQVQPFEFMGAQGDSYLVTSVNQRIKSIDEDECTAEGGVWRTIKGTHVCIKKGESVAEAFRRTTGKELESKTPKDLNVEKPQYTSGKNKMKIKLEDDIALGMIQQSKHLRITNVNWTNNTADVEPLDDIGEEQLKRFLNSNIAQKV
jgi:hypothetical protein